MTDKEDSGFTMIANDLIWNWQGDTYSFMIYCALKSFNPSFPSYSKLSQITGLSRPTIAKYLKKLTDRGLITYTKGNSARKSNQYQVTSKSGELVKEINQLKGLTRTSKRDELVLVNDVNSNNTNIIKLKNKTNISASQVTTEKLVDLWNIAYYPIIERGKCNTLTAHRVAVIKKAIKDFPLMEDWTHIFDEAIKQDWVADRNFPFTFDSIFEKGRYAKWRDSNSGERKKTAKELDDELSALFKTAEEANE